MPESICLLARYDYTCRRLDVSWLLGRDSGSSLPGGRRHRCGLRGHRRSTLPVGWLGSGRTVAADVRDQPRGVQATHRCTSDGRRRLASPGSIDASLAAANGLATPRITTFHHLRPNSTSTLLPCRPRQYGFCVHSTVWLLVSPTEPEPQRSHSRALLGDGEQCVHAHLPCRRSRNRAYETFRDAIHGVAVDAVVQSRAHYDLIPYHLCAP